MTPLPGPNFYSKFREKKKKTKETKNLYSEERKGARREGKGIFSRKVE